MVKKRRRSSSLLKERERFLSENNGTTNNTNISDTILDNMNDNNSNEKLSINNNNNNNNNDSMNDAILYKNNPFIVNWIQQHQEQDQEQQSNSNDSTTNNNELDIFLEHILRLTSTISRTTSTGSSSSSSATTGSTVSETKDEIIAVTIQNENDTISMDVVSVDSNEVTDETISLSSRNQIQYENNHNNSSSTSSNNNNNRNDPKILESIQYFNTIIRKKVVMQYNANKTDYDDVQPTDDTYPISLTDVAILILPWSIGKVLSLSSSLYNTDTNNDTTTTNPHTVKTTTSTNTILSTSIQILDSILSLLSFDQQHQFSSIDTNNNNTNATNTTITTVVVDDQCKKILNQSTLLKLVPLIGKMIIQYTYYTPNSNEHVVVPNETTTRNSIVTALQSSYKLLTTYWFKPTIDVACYQLLIPIIDMLYPEITSNASKNDKIIQDNIENDNHIMGCPILECTLQLIVSIIVHGSGNPKTTFQLFANTTIIQYLAKGFYILNIMKSKSTGLLNNKKEMNTNSTTTTTISSTTNSNGIRLLRTILHHTLFHPEYHFTGLFRLLQQGILLDKNTSNITTSKKKTQNKMKIIPVDITTSTKDIKMPDVDPIDNSTITTGSRKKVKYSSYQEDLFTSVTSIMTTITTPIDQNENDDNDNNITYEIRCTATVTDVVNVVLLLRELLHEFIHSSIEWNTTGRKEGGSTTGSSASGTTNTTKIIMKAENNDDDDIPIVQFELFTQLTRHILTLVSNIISTSSPVSTKDLSVTACTLLFEVCFESISKMLQLLIKYNIYMQSQNTSHRRQIKLLQHITDTVLQYFSTTTIKLSTVCTKHLLQIMKHLIQLNHTLVHTRITDTIFLILSIEHDKKSDDDNDNDNNNIMSNVIDLFTCWIDTYRRLRQAKHFFTSLFEVLHKQQSNVQDASNYFKIGLFKELLQKPKFGLALSSLVQSSPIVQVKDVVETISTWLTKYFVVVNEDSATTKSMDSLDCILSICSITFRSIRVDAGTARDVQSVCQSFESKTIQHLVTDNVTVQYDSSIVNAILLVTGWLLELNSQCVFWLGRKEELVIPSYVRQLVLDNIELFMNDTTKNTSVLHVNGLQSIACHLLRRLHLQIHDQDVFEKNEDSLQTESNTRNEMIAEAKTLALFIYSVGDTYFDEVSLVWIESARTFSLWMNYVDENSVKGFLRRVVLTYIDSIDLPVPKNERVITDTPMNNDVVHCVNSIMQDMSFYDQPRVSLFLLQVSTTEASNCICSTISKRSKNDIQLQVVNKITSKIESSTCTLPSCPATVLSTISRDFIPLSNLAEPFHINEVHTIEKAVKLILLSTKLVDFVVPDRELKRFIEILFRLEQAARSLHLINIPHRFIILDLVLALRTYITSIVSDIYSTNDCVVVDGTEEDKADLVQGIITSTIKLYQSHDEKCMNQPNSLIATSFSLVQCCSQQIFIVTKGVAKKITKMIDDCSLVSSTNFKESTISWNLIRSILVAFASKHSSSEPLDTILHSVYDLVKISLQTIHNVQDMNDNNIDDHQRKITADGILLLTESIQCKHGDTKHYKDVVCLIQTECIHFLTTMMNSKDEKNYNKDTSYKNAFHFAVTILVQKDDESTTLQDLIIDYIVQTNQHDGDSVLLQPLLIHLVSNIKQTSKLQKYIQQLFHYDDDYVASGMRLKQLSILLPYLCKNKCHIDVLNKYSKHIVVSSLFHLHPYNENSQTSIMVWSRNVQTACTIYDEFLRRRDIYIPKEMDHAILFSYMSCTIGSSSSSSVNSTRKDENDIISNAHEEAIDGIFISYSRLLTTLLNRYSKQLYSIVPSVVSLLHNLVRNVLYDTKTLQSTKSIVHRCKQLTTICELFVSHKDVYKKHVIGLVIEFINTLGAGGSGSTGSDKDITNHHSQQHQHKQQQRRDNILPAIYYILDTMSSIEIEQLNASIDVSQKALFKPIYSTYENLHVYKGQ